ncbi:hypothetical protein PHLGIDRAFT_69431, partial [Phlebiopsis gigantea 11061_1 CR5-6]
FIRGQRYSLLPALSMDGIVAMEIFPGSVNKEKFIHWHFVHHQQIAPILSPYPGRNSAVVFDNCAIHHDEEIRRIVVDEYFIPRRKTHLPSSSPDFNPIEQSFHPIKSWLRRHEDEATNANVRPWLIHQAAMTLTPELALPYIKNCGYE